MRWLSRIGDRITAAVRRRSKAEGGIEVRGHWTFTARDPDGNVKWREEIDNIVVNAGLNYLLDAGLSGGTPVTTWYVGLTDGTPTVAAGDTMGSHAGWVEVTAYDEANRPTWQDGGVSGQSVDNSGNTATFTISTNGTTVGGAFLVSTNVPGASPDSGTLYAAAAFSAGDKSLDDNDTLDVTATFTAAAA